MAHSLGLSQAKASDFAFVAAEEQDVQGLKPEDAEHSGLEGFSKLWSEGSEEGQVRSPDQQQLHREDKLEQQPRQDYHPEAAGLRDGGLTSGESLTGEPGELFNFSPEKRSLADVETGLLRSPAAASSRASTPRPQNDALHVVDFTPRVDKPYTLWTPGADFFSVLQEPPWGEEGELLTPMEAAQQAAYFASAAEMAAQRVAELEEGEQPPERPLASSWEDTAACPSPFSNPHSGRNFTSAQVVLQRGSRGADREGAPAALEGEILTRPSSWLAFSGAGGDKMSAIEAARYFSTRAIRTAGLAVAQCMQSFQIGEGASPLLLPSQRATAQLQQVHPVHQQLQNLAANTTAQKLKSGEDALHEPKHAAAQVASKDQTVTAFPITSFRVSVPSSSGPATSCKDSGAAQKAGEEQEQHLPQQEVQQRQLQEQEASQLEEQVESLQEQQLLLQKLEAELTQQKTQVQQETQQLLQQQRKTQRQLEVLTQREEDISRQREQLEMQREVQSRLQQELQLRDLQQRQQDMLQQQQKQQQELQNQHQRQQLQKEELFLQMRQQLLEQQLLSHQQVVADFERHASTQLLQREALQQQLQRQLEDLKVKEELLRHQQKEQAAREQELQQQRDEQKAKERQLQLQQDELQAKDRQLQRQQEEQEAREQDLQRRHQQQQDKERELQRFEEDQQERRKQLQQQQQQLAEQQQQQKQRLQELEQQMQQRDANGAAAARADGSVPLFSFLGGQELVQGEGPFRLLAGSNKSASTPSDWPLSAPQAYSGAPVDPTTQTPPSHACAGQGVTSGNGGGPMASTPQQNLLEPHNLPPATFGVATTGSKSCSAVTPSAPRQEQCFSAGPTPGAALDVGNAASVTTDEEGPPGRMLSSASEAFRRLPSGFQGGDLTLFGFTEGQAPPPAAIPSSTARGKTPSFLLTGSQVSPATTDATASEWSMRRLKQPLQCVQQPQLPRQQLARLPLLKGLGYGSGRAAAGGSAALTVLSGALVGPPGPFDT
ncbi:hypothetical protein Emag_003342 [Eimeria magna]